MKLWAGRFAKGTNQLVDDYNASISFDYRLAEYDIKGSLAHVEMLANCDIISEDDAKTIKDGLVKILEKIEKGDAEFRQEDEDIHMNIERMLHEEVGSVAGKLHTGRSRNDQVALDVHLYLRDNVLLIAQLLHDLLNTLHQLARDHTETILPGYTHLQRAEPVRLAHHFMAYFNMFNRDLERLTDSFKRVNQNPLGAGALAGSGFKVDRAFVTQALSFDGMYENSLDAVSDRDFVIEFLSNASMIMMHLSRLSEELILWSSQEFSFIQFDDAFCTGSSMMPQKKNPDVCELARGKTGRVYGSLIGLLTLLKGLPLAYNKDMQEDKEGLFDAVDTLILSLKVYTPMLASMKVNDKSMLEAAENDYSNATNFANYLVSKEIPFREAHEITGKLVLHCIDEGKLLNELSLEEFKRFSSVIDEEVFQVLHVEAVVEAHRAFGGTSLESVKAQLESGSEELKKTFKWLSDHKA